MAFFRGLIRSSKSNGSSSLFNYGRSKSNGSFSSDLWHRRPSGCREFSRTAGADVTSFMYAVKHDFPGLVASSAVGWFVGLGISKIIFLPYSVLLEELDILNKIQMNKLEELSRVVGVEEEIHRKNVRQLIEELRIQMAKLRAEVEIAKAVAGRVGAEGGDEARSK
ncbi:hypothetical protein ABFS82_02G137700 [Erythranthe guttata]|uniref:Uncharacterized protein n=1 Tax=Erythranthe guttata TaxID=4155 RepID=A0A022RIS6_ERYGU|nr:PREDICTED: uncharacterized protein LOC105954757 [Erythranthe guttata]EYU40332.1 hypothetical protein MIMGU_mgv1a015203mg [Erythranthe guttata]|eukprot:XP_012833892.1 PREDICTED: uncharacterized protein LOC105954757 [Erythranthe guttata]